MSIEMEELPRHMDISTLIDRCLSEIDHYRHGERSSDQYCLEMFRRAMLQHDNNAWTFVVEHFQDFLLRAFRRHPKRAAATLLDSPENYVAKAFERFWLAAAHNQQLEFASLGAALCYLRGCLNGAILDVLRAHSRSKEVALPEPGFLGEPIVGNEDDSSGLWKVVQSMLPKERERRVAYLLFHCNLKPRDIVHHCPHEFSNVQEIYRLRRSIIERLLRDSEQIRWRLHRENA